MQTQTSADRSDLALESVVIGGSSGCVLLRL